jgi:hypothetical protein
VRVAQQRTGNAETSVHASREGAHSLVGETAESDDVEDVIRPVGRDSRSSGQHAQVTASGTRRMAWHITQEHAQLASEVGDSVHWPATEESNASPGLKLEHETQSARLARTLGAQKHGDTTGTSLEGEVVDGRLQLVTARQTGEPDGLDHRFSRGTRGGRIQAR